MPEGGDPDSEERRARMNLAEILEALRQERAAVEEAIAAFERLAASQPKRRGRPPKWLSEARKKRAPQE